MNAITFFIRHKAAFVRINKSEIDLIESGDKFSKIYAGTKLYCSNYTISELEVLLSDFGFLRVGRSYIVPLNRIETITEDSIILGNKEITIGKKVLNKLLSTIHLLSNIRRAL